MLILAPRGLYLKWCARSGPMGLLGPGDSPVGSERRVVGVVAA